MEYDLHDPCPKCPFRTDRRAYLTRRRVREIAQGLNRGEFACHMTLDYTDAATNAGLPVETPKSQHCAGALILLEKVNRPSQMMRICERLGFYDHTKLNLKAPVFDTWKEMIDAQHTR